MTDTNRRTFLKTSALAAGFAALRGAAAEAPAQAKSQYHLFSRSFGAMDYDRLSETAAAAGYDGIEWTVRPGGHVLPERVREDLPRAAAAARRQGLKNVMLVTGFDRGDAPHCGDLFRTAADCGFSKIRTGHQLYDEKRDLKWNIARIHSNFASFAALGEKTGVQAAFQNHDAWNAAVFGSSVWDLGEATDGLDPRWMAVQFDVHHCFFQIRSAWMHGFDRVADRVGSLVLKDGFHGPSGGRRNCPAGEGKVPFKAFRERLALRNLPQVPFTVHLEWYTYKGQPDVTQTIKKELDWFKGVFG